MNKAVTTAVTFLGTVLVLVVVGWVLWQFISPRFDNFRNRENPNIVPFYVHFNYDKDLAHIVLEGERMRGYTPPLIHNGRAYLPLDFIRGYIDPFMFWDRGAQTLFVSTRYEMQTFRPGDVRIVTQEGEALVPVSGVFVPADLIMGLYAVCVAFHPEYNMVVVTCSRTPQRVSQVNDAAPVRYSPDPAAPMTARLSPRDTVTLLGDTYEKGGWMRIRTASGLLGYIQTAALGAVAYEAPPARSGWLFTRGSIDNFAPRPVRWDISPVNLVWVTTSGMANPLPESVNVVSPTWFRFNAETRGLDSTASAAYVAWAREQGVRVWPNVTDVYADPGIGDILSDAAARRRVIDRLVYYVDTLGLDGLSINIESLRMFRYGPYYVQFMRELNLALGHRIVIMAAMLADPAINPHYRHDLIAKTIDFVAVMTYDEHHGNSPEAGPIASLPWVERQIHAMLRLVPPEQLIMGLPFYNRVWRTSIAENVRRGSLNWGMDWAAQQIYERGLTPEWDALIGSYYIEWAAVIEGETLRHQLWLECPRSINEKMHVYAAHNLAGVAGWNLEFTNDAVWEVIGTFFTGGAT